VAAPGVPAAGRRRFALRGPLGPRLTTVGLVLAALSLVLPWYAIDNNESGAHAPLLEYTLTQEARHDRDGTTHLTPFDVAACRCPQVAAAFGQAQVLMWTGAVLAVVAYWLGRTRSRLPASAQFALSLAAGVLIAAGPIILALNLPPALLADGERVSNVVPIGRWGAGFWGSHVENIVQTTAWGPGLGWFAALAGAALTLAGASRRRPAEPTEAAPSAAPVRAPTPHAAAPPASPMPAE
jgi:hypothetical protein